MPKSRHWSTASAPCRLDWRPSWLLAGSLLALGLLAAAAILGSAIPAAAAWPSALLVSGYGGWLGRRELRRPVRGLVIADGAGAVIVDGVAVAGFSVQWRGPLAFVHWRDASGSRRRLQFGPDTLDLAARRELRLAMITRGAAPAAGSMAP